MDQEKINEILREHKEWVESNGGEGNRADFHGIDLRGAMMPKGIYTAGGVGSEQRYTYYDAVNDRVICGCWNDDSGNHLDSFKERIEDVYGKNGNTPNQKHYRAYQAVIRYF